MFSMQWLAIAALVSAPLSAIAQQKQPQYDPTDANAPVHAIGYESAFKGYRASDDGDNTPDELWRSANEEVGRLGGHSGHMKDREGQSGVSADRGNAAPKQGGTANHSRHH